MTLPWDNSLDLDNCRIQNKKDIQRRGEPLLTCLPLLLAWSPYHGCPQTISLQVSTFLIILSLQSKAALELFIICSRIFSKDKHEQYPYISGRWKSTLNIYDFWERSVTTSLLSLDKFWGIRLEYNRRNKKKPVKRSWQQHLVSFTKKINL